MKTDKNTILGMMMMIASCGQQSSTTPTNTTGTTANAASPIVTAQDTPNGGSTTPITPSDANFARLVDSISDIACTAQNTDQLIYVKTENSFYFCDTTLQWTAIAIQSPAAKNGTNGTNGVAGANGVDGTNGTNGTNGTDGTDGAPGIAIVGTYSHIDYSGAYILNNDPNQDIQTMTLAVFSDGSYSFTASVFISGTVYNPTFWVSANRAKSTQILSFKVTGSLNRLDFSFPSGTDMLTTAKTAVDSQGDSGQQISIGAKLYTNGNASPNFLTLPVNYEY